MKRSSSSDAMSRVVQGLSIFMIIVTAINLLRSGGPALSNLTRPRSPKSYSYVGHDHPETWTIEGLKPAALTAEESVHYMVDTEVGEREWSTILPRGNGYIRLGPPDHPQTFRLSLFKQLDCLNIVRKEMLFRRANKSIPAGQRAHHCLNYLRQSITCHADSHLEMVRSEYGGRAVLPYTTRTTCKDWSTIWNEVERNYDEWVLGTHSNQTI